MLHRVQLKDNVGVGVKYNKRGRVRGEIEKWIYSIRQVSLMTSSSILRVVI